MLGCLCVEVVDEDDVCYMPDIAGVSGIDSIEGDFMGIWESPLGAGWCNGAHAVWLDSRGDRYVKRDVEGHRLFKYDRD